MLTLGLDLVFSKVCEPLANLYMDAPLLYLEGHAIL